MPHYEFGVLNYTSLYRSRALRVQKTVREEAGAASALALAGVGNVSRVPMDGIDRRREEGRAMDGSVEIGVSGRATK